MLQDTEACIENAERFVRRAVAHATVWGIRNGLRFQGCCSNDDESRSVLLFWSDAAYARRAVKNDYPNGVVVEISLFDFLFRWLPGMDGDGLLVGTNFTAHLHGLELNPMELQQRIIDELSDEQVEDYRRRLDEGVRAERECQ